MLTPVWDVLVYVVLPLWVLAGFADYLCHRATHIEQASGFKESLIHWLMLGEVGVPLLLAVFFKINALLITIMIVALIAHELTANIDLRLAIRTRHVSTFEHQVHSLLEVLPFAAMLLVSVLHWGQLLTLFGQGGETPDWSLALKQLPALSELGPPALAFVAFGVFPYAEEFVRGLLAHPRGRLNSPATRSRSRVTIERRAHLE